MMNTNSRQFKIVQLGKNFWYCILLSWKASKCYTFLQFFARIALLMLPIAVTCNTKEILDVLSYPKRTDSYVKLLICIFFMLILYLLNLLFMKIEIYSTGMQRDLLSHYVEKELAKTALDMELEYFDNPHYYDAFEVVKRDVYSVTNVVFQGIAGIGLLFSVGSCLFFLKGMVSGYTLSIVLLLIPVSISEYFYTKKIYLWGVGHIREERQLQYLYRTVTERCFAQEIRLCNTGKYFTEKYQMLWNIYFSGKRAVVRKRAIWNFFLAALPEIFSVVALWHVALCVLYGEYTVGDFSLYSGLLMQLTSGLGQFVSCIMGLYDEKLKIDHLIDFQTLVQKKIGSGSRILGKQVDIEFQDVSFRYPGTDRYVLKHVSFHLTQGEKLCIVGENGAGKSTILKLLLHFYEIETGRILLNGYPVEDYDRDSLRQGFSCFFQNESNYAFTLKENVRLSQLEKACTTADADQEKAFQMAGIQEGFINILPFGIDTFLTRIYEDKGVELSGGQNQKVALARMFYRDAPVFIMDEPTAALDPKSEHDLFKVLQKEFKDKSLLFVSHRLSNVFLADEILVMEDGKVCAKGTHDELMKQCETYKRLYNYQAEKYFDGGCIT